MGKSQRLRLCDIKAVYLLLGECTQFGALPERWSRHIHEGLARMLGVQVTVMFVGGPGEAFGHSGPTLSTDILSHGWPSAESRQIAEDYFRSGGARLDENIAVWSNRPERVLTVSRDMLVPDAVWYRSEAFNRFYGQGGQDATILSRGPLPGGRWLLLNPWRAVGDPQFSERDVKIVHLLACELRNRYGRELTPTRRAGVDLPPRLRQVLAMLADGLSEKEVAAELHLSPHTVHDHVKRLHERLGVSSRGELLAVCRPWLAPPK